MGGLVKHYFTDLTLSFASYSPILFKNKSFNLRTARKEGRKRKKDAGRREEKKVMIELSVEFFTYAVASFISSGASVSVR